MSIMSVPLLESSLVIHLYWSFYSLARRFNETSSAGLSSFRLSLLIYRLKLIYLIASASAILVSPASGFGSFSALITGLWMCWLFEREVRSRSWFFSFLLSESAPFDFDFSWVGSATDVFSFLPTSDFLLMRDKLCCWRTACSTCCSADSLTLISFSDGALATSAGDYICGSAYLDDLWLCYFVGSAISSSLSLPTFGTAVYISTASSAVFTTELI